MRSVRDAGSGMPGPVHLWWARWRCALWRFGVLPYAHRLLRGAREGQVLSRPFAGRRLYLEVARSNAQKLLYLEGERFVPERWLLRELVPNGATVVDVGANIGYFALLFAQAVGPSGRVLSVEPDPDNLRELRRNVGLNEVQNVEVLAAAAGSRDGVIGLATGLNSTVVQNGPGDLQVDLRKLDSIAPDQVGLIKIDVEGFEWEVLQGAMAVIEAQAPTLWLELHPALLPSAHSPIEIISWIAQRYRKVEMISRSLPRGFGAEAAGRYRTVGRFARVLFDEAGLDRLVRESNGEPLWIVASPGDRRDHNPGRL